ncbi:PadR family transcriptional regulator [Gephyromycinifex aptenodytis]|uniref:PadR family transcriptional regulator n=1 Tax=Gephyromycinifex aptenodytis TaxID=2716227 RepID=UPI0014456D97|nr:PadR family transcriptional regulator [Gephyromycinifex aptenodytis]
MSTSWPSEWLRGVIGTCVLRVLAEGPTYGYAISASLEELGLGAVKGGTLYPLLRRFEEAGWVEIEWRAGDGGPGRKYYALTTSGREQQRQQAAAWTEFARLTADFVAAPAATASATSDAAAHGGSLRHDS